jgi:hypothetical protein
MKTAILLLAAAAATLPATPALAQRSTAGSITLETGPCYGFCPVYRVTVRADGTGVYEGIRHVAVRGQRRFRLSPAQYRAFARHLEPIRPARGSIRYSTDAALCGPVMTDMPSTEVTWQRGRTRQSLYFYYGCRRQRAIGERLERAPGLLPIGPWIARPAVNGTPG